MDKNTCDYYIELLGEDFRWLKHRGNKWLAQQRRHPVSLGDLKVIGDTPLETLSKLYEIVVKNK